MEPSPARLIEAFRNSQDHLRGIVEPLDSETIRRPSYAAEWSIAQVLSHLGSQAEIFGQFLDATLSGNEPPGRDAFGPIWDAWNKRSPDDQVADSLRANEDFINRLESLTDGERQAVRLQMFGADADLGMLVGMRVSEHAIHTWDVAVAIDQAATVTPEAVGLIIDRLDQLATRTGKPDGRQRRIHIVTTDPERQFVLETGEAVTLQAAETSSADGAPRLRLPAEALVRLIYGRLDEAHTPPVQEGVAYLDELRAIFPGF